MKRLLAALVMVLTFDGAVLADDWSVCHKAEDLDPSIRACANTIAGGRENPGNLPSPTTTVAVLTPISSCDDLINPSHKLH